MPIQVESFYISVLCYGCCVPCFKLNKISLSKCILVAKLFCKSVLLSSGSSASRWLRISQFTLIFWHFYFFFSQFYIYLYVFSKVPKDGSKTFLALLLLRYLLSHHFCESPYFAFYWDICLFMNRDIFPPLTVVLPYEFQCQKYDVVLTRLKSVTNALIVAWFITI